MKTERDAGYAAKEKETKDYSDRTKFFSCYSPRVLEHLLDNGFTEHTIFVNIMTSKTCHVFLQSKELSACIAEVSKPKE